MVRADLCRTQGLQFHFLEVHQQAQFYQSLARLGIYERGARNYKKQLQPFAQFVDNFSYFPSHVYLLEEGVDQKIHIHTAVTGQTSSSCRTFPPSTISTGRAPGAISSFSATIPRQWYTVVARSSIVTGLSNGSAAIESDAP